MYGFMFTTSAWKLNPHIKCSQSYLHWCSEIEHTINVRRKVLWRTSNNFQIRNRSWR